MSKITTCTLPAEDIASWIAEIEREYPTLPHDERRIARKKLRPQAQDLAFGFKQVFRLLLRFVGRNRLDPLVETVGGDTQTSGDVGKTIPAVYDLPDCSFLEFRGKPLRTYKLPPMLKG